MLIYQVTVEIAAPPLGLIKTFSFDSEERRDDFAFEAAKWGFIKVTHKGFAIVMTSVADAIAECAKERASV